jgi:hypothetical protein
MVSLEYFSLKARTHPVITIETRIANFCERLFFVWISAIAAMAFLAALFLTIIQLISLTQLFYVYAAMGAITLLLAGLLYLARRSL